MGGYPYWYFVEYEPDIVHALQKLRQREFQAGRYNPVMPFPLFPVTSASPALGCGHLSIDDAMTYADADGTRSILDIFRVGSEPDFFTAYPLPGRTLEALYRTKRPTRTMVEHRMEFAESAERLQCA